MDINGAFPSQYLKASDLKGAQPIVTIDRIEFEPVGQKKEMKPILYFAGKDKGLVLNKTNAANIIKLTGTTETEEWQGFAIRLFATTVEFQGESVDAIRVKAAPPDGKPAAKPVVEAEDIDADSIPF